MVTHSFVVSQALKGVRALSVRIPKSKFPITPDVLRHLCYATLNAGFPSQTATRLVSMFLLAFHAFLRVGELCDSRHALQLENLLLRSSNLIVQFPTYKFSAGRCPSVFIPACPSPLCPVKAMRSYLQLRGNNPGPLFLSEEGFPLSIMSFRSELAKAVRAANLSSWGITPHSSRVGAATSAAALGIPEETIQHMGRWTSRAFMSYIKFQINKL